MPTIAGNDSSSADFVPAPASCLRSINDAEGVRVVPRREEEKRRQGDRETGRQGEGEMRSDGNPGLKARGYR